MGKTNTISVRYGNLNLNGNVAGGEVVATPWLDCSEIDAEEFTVSTDIESGTYATAVFTLQHFDGTRLATIDSALASAVTIAGQGSITRGDCSSLKMLRMILTTAEGAAGRGAVTFCFRRRNGFERGLSVAGRGADGVTATVTGGPGGGSGGGGESAPVGGGGSES